MKRSRRALAVTSVVLALAACGGGDRELVGYTRVPEPEVDVATLPDVSRGGEPFAMRAADGDLLAVFFGYTSCPDVCPTTLADLRSALRDLGDAASRVDLAMVTVDPDRDLAVLAEYVQGFVPDAHALGTDDPALLRQVADAFGASYVVTTHGDEHGDGHGEDGQAGKDGEDGEDEPEVAHSSELYLVDDTGSMVLTWPFGTTPDDLAADMRHVLDR